MKREWTIRQRTPVRTKSNGLTIDGHLGKWLYWRTWQRAGSTILESDSYGLVRGINDEGRILEISKDAKVASSFASCCRSACMMVGSKVCGIRNQEIEYYQRRDVIYTRQGLQVPE